MYDMTDPEIAVNIHVDQKPDERANVLIYVIIDDERTIPLTGNAS